MPGEGLGGGCIPRIFISMIAMVESVCVCARACTYIVQIDIGTAIVGKNEVSDGVGTLNGVLVAVEGFQEPRVLRSNELAGFFIGPQL